MLSIDFLMKYKNFSYVSEFLIDDFAIDQKSPPKIAYKLGLGFNGKRFPDFYIEYTRINRWTGNYFNEELRYISNNVLIGHPLGPDSHTISLDIFNNSFEKLFTIASFSYIESGSGDIHDWPEGISAGWNFGYNSEPFPSSPLTIEYRIDVNSKLIFSKNISVDFNINLSSLKQNDYKFGIIYNI